MEITRSTGQVGEMPHGDEAFVDQPVLHLFVVKLEAERVIVRARVQCLAQLLDG